MNIKHIHQNIPLNSQITFLSQPTPTRSKTTYADFKLNSVNTPFTCASSVTGSLTYQKGCGPP